MHTEISPWVEKLSPYRLVIAIGAAGLVLVVALVWVAWRWSVAEGRMELMKKQAEVGFLQAPSTNRTVRIDLRAPALVSVGGGEFPERVDLAPECAHQSLRALSREPPARRRHAPRTRRSPGARLELRSPVLAQQLDPAGRALPRSRRGLCAKRRSSSDFAEARLTAG